MDKKEKILLDYIKLKKKHGSVGYNLLRSKGITESALKHFYLNIEGLDKAAREKYPDEFKDVLLDNIYCKKKIKDLRKQYRDKKRFIIVSAVLGCQVHEGFLSCIRHYCKVNDAILVVLLSADPASVVGNTIDKSLLNDYIIFEDTALNSNLHLSTIKLSAKQIDPITSLGRIGQRTGSFIYASPKQRLKVVPVSNRKLPRTLVTTGAITLPNYDTKRYMSERTAHISNYDHVIGGVIVEIEDNKIFHLRHVQAHEDGTFIDLCKKYTINTVEKVRPAAFVLGDWHCGSTDKKAAIAWDEVICAYKPYYLILHDLFDGKSISHHEMKNKILRAKRSDIGDLSLEKELRKVSEDLKYFSKVSESVIIVKSNHDEFLERYLSEGAYINDPHNYRASLLLSLQMIENIDPLKFGVEYYGGKKFDNVRWLKRDEDFKIAGVQLGAHGDKGANGAKGSVMSMETAYGNCISGHCLTENHSVNTIDRGWVKISDIKESDIVLSYNHKIKSNIWAKVDKKIENINNYTGFIFKIGHNIWQQEVTENHYMFTADGEYISICEAIEKVPIHKIPIVSLPAKNRIIKEQIEPNLLRLIIAVCADGSFDKQNYNLRFHLKKVRKIDRLNLLYENLSNEKLIWGKISKTGSKQCSIPKSSKIYDDIIKYVDPKSKSLPELLRWQSVENKEIIIDEIKYWDGTYKETIGGQQYSTSKEKEADLIHSILNELGYRATLLRRYFSGLSKTKGYVISFNTDRKSPIVSKKSDGSITKWGVIPKKVYNISTFCLVTKYKNFWVKNDLTGQTSLTGNSHVPEALRNAWTVGTSSELRLEYNEGPSSWVHASCLLYSSGARQMIMAIDGKWRL